jgi:hypothetical protein
MCKIHTMNVFDQLKKINFEFLKEKQILTYIYLIYKNTYELMSTI